MASTTRDRSFRVAKVQRTKRSSIPPWKKSTRLPGFGALCKAANIEVSPQAKSQNTLLPLIDDAWDHKQPEHQYLNPSDNLFQHYFPVVDTEDSGCYDTWLWQALRGKSLSEWLHLLCYRANQRPLFAADHKGKFKQTSLQHGYQQPAQNHGEFVRPKGRFHNKLETERRERHRDFMTNIDQLCGDFHFDLADQHMNNVKEMYSHDLPANKSRSPKVIGKDELLLAAQLALRMQRWIIEAFLDILPQTPQASPLAELLLSNNHNDNLCQAAAAMSLPPSPPPSQSGYE